MVWIVLACFAFAGVVSGASTAITGPTVISEPGNYILANSIANSTEKTCILITVPNVVLDGRGNSIDGVDGADSIGIKAYNSAMTLFNVIIRNVKLSDWGTGLYLQNVKNSQIQSVAATNNTGNGIMLQGSMRNTIESCTASSNGATGIILYSTSDSNTVRDTTANGNGYDGIRIRFSSNNDVLNNDVLANKENGIHLYEAGNYNTITDNTITGNKLDAIRVYKSDGNIISGNTITDTGVVGIRLYEDSDNNEVSDNSITDSDYHGILVYVNADDNTIFSNTVEQNAMAGIFLQNTTRNSIYNNILRDNTGEGMYLTGTSSNVMTNNFFFNDKNAVLSSSAGANTWNLPRSAQGSTGRSREDTGGNSWGQPNGQGFSQITPATNGICDEPYVLAHNNIDNLPLKWERR
jgi:parallel beta-helix repeat protein